MFKLGALIVLLGAGIVLGIVYTNQCDTDNGHCSQTCENFQGEYRCTCDDGYSFDKTGISGGCAPTCVSAIGAVECLCKTGYHFVKTGADSEGYCLVD